jgi:hypothetical protein
MPEEIDVVVDDAAVDPPGWSLNELISLSYCCLLRPLFAAVRPALDRIRVRA